MEHLCTFHPNHLPGNDSCGNIATRQIYLKSRNYPDNPAIYYWICDDCLPEALAWWKECDQIVEF